MEPTGTITPVLGHEVSASVAMEKLVAPELSQQPLVLGPFVQSAAAAVIGGEADEVVEDTSCLFSRRMRFEIGSTEAPVRPRSKPKESLVNNIVVSKAT